MRAFLRLTSRAVLVMAVLAAGALAGLVKAGPVQAAALPGGKANFVITQGFLDSSSLENWVRLGNYQFSTDGTVLARTYLWWQRYPEARIGTGTTPDSSCSTTAGSSLSQVRTCEVLTAGGFRSSPEETRTGTFTYSNGVVSISWQISQTWNEEWYLTLSADGKLAKLDYKYNTLARYGYGYGSNAALTTRRAMSTVLAFPGTLKLDQAGWANGQISTVTGQTFGLSSFRQCTSTTWCLTYHQPSSAAACQAAGGCPNYGGGTAADDSSIEYYLVMVSSGDRRDTMWHWCRCLAKERGEFCYTGNSHVKPMYQVIDDDGAFHGWVGAEASFYNSPSADPRAHDQLSVFRMADFR
jgi:hypothetical protein